MELLFPGIASRRKSDAVFKDLQQNGVVVLLYFLFVDSKTFKTYIDFSYHKGCSESLSFWQGQDKKITAIIKCAKFQDTHCHIDI